MAERHSLTEELPPLFRTSSYTPLIRTEVRLRKWSTNRKRHGYATRSNQHRVVKTPGGKLVYRTTKKRASGPKCPVTGKSIQGIPHLRPAEYRRSRLPRNHRTVNGAYGEEQKIMKKVLKIHKAKERVAAKS